MSDATATEAQSSTFEPADHDDVAVNALRFLAIDMVQKANSGHPGAPMGQAAMAYTLWSRHLDVCPEHPDWPARDRFVLSCGHASALIYGLLHLAGFDLPLDELRSFRQLGSKTPGHPEYGHTVGVDTTTGPLGQGISNAVGMAIAQRMLSDRFDRDGFELFDHRVWVIASDGDLMEGVASEASSLAGHLQLGRLNVLYDANQITIDGPTDLSFSEDVLARYAAYGWHTQDLEDGNDLAAVDAALRAAQADPRPSLIRVRTHIGYGSPNKQDSSAAHGAPLGDDEVTLTRTELGWTHGPFEIPDAAREAFQALRDRGAERHGEWTDLLDAYRDEHPEAAAELDRRLAGDLPEGLDDLYPRFAAADGPMATRKASGAVLNAVAPALPELMGGSADLAGSNNTMIKGEAATNRADVTGRNFNFGVREHGMGAVLNGMSLSGAIRPYGGTFLIFSDYFRPSIRLAALMEQPVIYVLTHDSIYVGEDGPTHQPVSQLLSLRSIPQLVTLRPADANETSAAWKVALERTAGPTALILTRQGLPVLEEASALGVARGGYVLRDAEGDADSILVATGSEVSLALDAQAALRERGHDPRVVSLPSWELFEAQDAAYRASVLPPDVTRRVGIEAGSPLGWDRYVGPAGAIVAQRGFGASAPGKALGEHFGFTVEAVVEAFEGLG